MSNIHIFPISLIQEYWEIGEELLLFTFLVTQLFEPLCLMQFYENGLDFCQHHTPPFKKASIFY